MKKNPYKHGDTIYLFGLKYTYRDSVKEFFTDEDKKNPLKYSAPTHICWDEHSERWHAQGWDGATPRTVFLKVLRGDQAGLKDELKTHQDMFELMKSRLDALENVLKQARTK